MHSSHDLATRLISARASKQAISAENCRTLQVGSRADAYAVQAATWQQTQGARRPGAWKIGNASDDPAPVRAAMPEVLAHGSRAARARFRLVGIECEIAVRFARALPPRAGAYSHDEVLAAIGSAHVAIEIVDTALADYLAAGPLLGLADSMLHGSFVLGDAIADWPALQWAALTAQSFIDCELIAAKTGAHPLRDPFTNLIWWANEGALAWGGIQAGDIVTTGSWNGMHFADNPRTFEARFTDANGKTLGCALIAFD